jgi:hypothetical protein
MVFLTNLGRKVVTPSVHGFHREVKIQYPEVMQEHDGSNSSHIAMSYATILAPTKAHNLLVKIHIFLSMSISHTPSSIYFWK